MKIVVTIIVVLFGVLSAQNTKEIYTSRQINYVRDGAGSYYGLVETLPAGTKVVLLSKEDKWSKIKTPSSKSGWLANNCFESARKSGEVEKKLLGSYASIKSSRIGIAAAIKGLLGKFDKGGVNQVDDLSGYLSDVTGGIDLRNFSSSLVDDANRHPTELKFDEISKSVDEYNPSLKETQIGAGIAASLISRGIVKDKNITTYLNSIAAALLRNTKYYDWDFYVFILDDKKIDGFACPGGYIFVTKGAVESCADESELAAIIAHEMGHLILRHATKEMKERDVSIKSEAAFDELDKISGKDSTELELEEMMESSYNRICFERLLNYEKDADMFSALLCANSGYDPEGIVRVTQKLIGLRVQNNDVFSANYLSPNDLKLRYDNVSKYVGKKLSGWSGKRLQERFKSMVNGK